MLQEFREQIVPTATISTSYNTASRLRDFQYLRLHLFWIVQSTQVYPQKLRWIMFYSRTFSSKTLTCPTVLKCRSLEDPALTVASHRPFFSKTLLPRTAKISHGPISSWLQVKLSSASLSLALEATITASFSTKTAHSQDQSVRFWATTQPLETMSQSAKILHSQIVTGATLVVSRFCSSNLIFGTKVKVTFGQFLSVIKAVNGIRMSMFLATGVTKKTINKLVSRRWLNSTKQFRFFTLRLLTISRRTDCRKILSHKAEVVGWW